MSGPEDINGMDQTLGPTFNENHVFAITYFTMREEVLWNLSEDTF